MGQRVGQFGGPPAPRGARSTRGWLWLAPVEPLPLAADRLGPFSRLSDRCHGGSGTSDPFARPKRGSVLTFLLRVDLHSAAHPAGDDSHRLRRGPPPEPGIYEASAGIRRCV